MYSLLCRISAILRFYQIELFRAASLAQIFLAINLPMIAVIEGYHFYILPESGF